MQFYTRDTSGCGAGFGTVFRGELERFTKGVQSGGRATLPVGEDTSLRHQLLLLAVLALVAGNVFLEPAQAASSGAIFTTTANGSRVNANLFSSKCEVYLDGGPGPNAPAGAAGLPDGHYYFQVTDPSGTQLLSTEPVRNRRFLVSGGVIVAYTGAGTHATGYDRDHPELGAITIRLADATCPADFKDSPNGGGVYKVWATPESDFVGDPSLVDNSCGSGCFHGFLSSKSKTDNFKVKSGAESFCLTVWKRVLEAETEVPGAQWPISVVDPAGVRNDYFTDNAGFLQVCGLTEGAGANKTYIVREDPQGLAVSELLVNGVSLTPQPSYSFEWRLGSPEPVVIFKNSDGGGIPDSIRSGSRAQAH